MSEFLIIIAGLIVLIILIKSTKNSAPKNLSPPLKTIKPEVLLFNAFDIDLSNENYSIYLYTYGRRNLGITPGRFLLKGTKYTYYQYVIIKDNLNCFEAYKKPQFNVRVYNNGNDEFFEYTTNLILKYGIDIIGQSAYGDNYYCPKKMHKVSVSYYEKKELMRRIFKYFKEIDETKYF